MGSMMNLTKYSYWANGNEGQGCAPGCNLFHGLVLNRVYNWEGFTKETPLPYICASGCAVGYAVVNAVVPEGIRIRRLPQPPFS